MGAIERLAGRRWVQAALVLIAGALVALPGLGRHGFRSTEGHRVIPAWELLDRGEPLPTRMFEQVYVRKPPGMAWAIAGSSAVLGRSELAARLPAAMAHILMGCIAWAFATRWMGSPWGLGAGLAQALIPRFWFSARAAEIEHPMLLGTQVAALALIDLLLVARGRGERALMAGLVAIGVFGLSVMKGPAAYPVIAGCLAAVCVVRRSGAPLADRAVWTGIGLGLAGFGAIAVLAALSIGDERVVLADENRKLLVPGYVLEFPEFLAVLLIGSLPMTAALVFPLGDRARAEVERAQADDADRRATLVARTLALGLLLSLGLFMALLIGNPRYGLPALVLAPPVVAYALRGRARFFDAARARLARVLLLGHPLAWPAVLLGVLVWWIGVFEPARGADSGREPGVALGELLPDGAAIWADDMIESRPETLLYARRAAERAGRDVRVRWRKFAIERRQPPPPGTLLLLRTDELEAYRRAGHGGRFERIASGDVYQYDFVLVRAGAEPSDVAGGGAVADSARDGS